MLTNTLLLYVTQEALTKARKRLKGRKEGNAEPRHAEVSVAPSHWQVTRRPAEKRGAALRH